MDLDLREAIVESIRRNPQARSVILATELDPGGTGSISYNPTGVLIDPTAPGFTGSAAPMTDEEVVRAYLLVKLATGWGYPSTPQTLEIERVYKPVGRPTGKGGRVDLLVRRKPKNGKTGSVFLFIEVKAPSSFDSDMRYIDGQLFRLSLQETPRPRYLVYFTVELKGGELRDRVILIDTDTFSTFESWDDGGQPIVDTIPTAYGLPPKRRLANVPKSSELYRPLDKETTAETFNRIRAEIHDVIWGGGGTNNNEVFVCITKLILCKIFDETETPPGQEYRFQRLGDAVQPETAADLVNRINDLYRAAEASLLALPSPSAMPTFDTTRISAEKIAYVVGRLEGLSITENVHPGDLLSEFFEQIVGQDFTQTKGQFFTPVKLVRFMLYLSDAVEQARETMWHGKDHLGRPRLPYVIDPSCGSGTFLIEYMKAIRDSLGTAEVALSLPRRMAEAHKVWFSGSARSTWAREHLFGIENNYDLGLAAKVNMVLHGDGSMNTWILSALLPFKDYFVDGRNLLGVAQSSKDHPYPVQRNEQFDLVLSNPPFSLTLSPDDKHKVKVAFHSLASSRSEALFIERWYQLLKDEGVFCCILPEGILDTSSNSHI